MFLFIVILICIACIIWGIMQQKKNARTKAEQDALEQKRRAELEAAAKARKELEQKRSAEFAAQLDGIPAAEISLSAKKAARISERLEVKTTNITKRSNLDAIFPLVVIDTETTGLDPLKNEIIEIAAIRYERGLTPVSSFTTLCKPSRKIPEKASAVNHITDDMVADAPGFGLVADALSDFLAGCNLAGHNLEFDLQFLYASGVRIPEKAKCYDTLSLAKNTLRKDGGREYDHHEGHYVQITNGQVPNYKLTTLCDYYGIYRSDAHRALSDCHATALIFAHLIKDKTGNEFTRT